MTSVTMTSPSLPIPITTTTAVSAVVSAQTRSCSPAWTLRALPLKPHAHEYAHGLHSRPLRPRVRSLPPLPKPLPLLHRCWHRYQRQLRLHLRPRRVGEDDPNAMLQPKRFEEGGVGWLSSRAGNAAKEGE